MKILFLTHRVPYPANKGDKLRAFNILRHLSREHSIWLAALTENVQDLKYRNELLKVCREVEIIFSSKKLRLVNSTFSLLSDKPLTLAYFYSARLAAALNQLRRRERFDLIYIYSSAMAQYALAWPGVPKIMDFIDVDSDKWRQYGRLAGWPMRLVYRLEARRLKAYEQKIAAAVDYCIAASDAEIAVFQSFLPKVRLAAVANGVDYSYFQPSNGQVRKKILIFTGTMDYFANVDAMLYFTREILPLIKNEVPDVQLAIVGANPTKAVQRLARDKGTLVSGFVEDIRPYLAQSAVYIAPLRISRGLRNKILEAMAAGLPVVATPSALCGIKAKPGQDLLVADDAPGFARETIGLLRDSGLSRKIAQNGRRLVEKNFDWNANLREIDKVIAEL